MWKSFVGLLRVTLKSLIMSAEPGPSAVVKKTKKKKFAFMLSYVGTNFYGMQINKGFSTIEEELFKALGKLELIDDVHNPSGFWFQRAARTDKGVSACRQMVSILLPMNEDEIPTTVAAMNGNLPPDIRVMGIKRATKGFDAQKSCSSRSYSYTMPSFALTPVEKVVSEDFRVSSEELEKTRSILSVYKGSHNFFNYTSRREHADKSCVRYIISIELSEPFLVDSMEFVTINLQGQSFMLHQIRKMVGLCIAITRGYLTKIDLQKSWEGKRMDVPMAPGLGLLLEKIHYEHYDRKYSKDHPSLDKWEEQEEAVKKFREENILRHIFETEKTERSMFNWLSTLSQHSFNAEESDAPRVKRPRSRSPIGLAANLVRTSEPRTEEEK